MRTFLLDVMLRIRTKGLNLPVENYHVVHYDQDKSSLCAIFSDLDGRKYKLEISEVI